MCQLYSHMSALCVRRVSYIAMSVWLSEWQGVLDCDDCVEASAVLQVTSVPSDPQTRMRAHTHARTPCRRSHPLPNRGVVAEAARSP
jgi:hypothetical protein